MELIRAHKLHMQEEHLKASSQVLRTSRYFTMTRRVHRYQHGRGAKFQNHKITSYVIQSRENVFSSAWTPNDDEVSALIKADFERDHWVERRAWKFYNRRDADKAWVLLMLRWGHD